MNKQVTGKKKREIIAVRVKKFWKYREAKENKCNMHSIQNDY